MTDEPLAQAATAERRRRYRAGLTAETIAALWLIAKGHRIIERRARTPFGEIDLVVVRGARVSFVEVKARRTAEAAEAALPARQRERVKRASTIWLQRHPRYQSHEITFDVVFVLPWRPPRHLVNAL